MQEFRDLPKISLMQSEFDINKIQIEGLTVRNKYIETDIKDTVCNLKCRKFIVIINGLLSNDNI